MKRDLYIICGKCNEEFDREDNISIDNLESNEYNEDIVKFRCPKCGNKTHSMVYSR